MINKLQLKAFYESHKDEYYERRNSDDKSKWDEAYKWDIFPKLNELLAEHKTTTADNLPEIVAILKKHNPQQGSFAHWIEMDNLGILTRHTNGWQVVAPLWQATPETIEDDIESVDTTGNFLIHHKFGNAMYGYMLTARDCDSFAIYHSSLMKELVELGIDDKPRTKGEQYKLFNDSSLYLGELMQADKLTSGLEQKALNGHDFMWVVWMTSRLKSTHKSVDQS